VLRRYANKSRVKATRRKVVLRRYANKSRVKATRRKVVLRRYANRSRVKATRRKVVLRRHANGSRVKATRRKSHVKIACKQKSCQATREPEALHLRYGNRVKQHAKLSRLMKPDNGKRTSEACKETGRRRRKERKLLENGPRN
jgi:hypothetical protein